MNFFKSSKYSVLFITDPVHTLVPGHDTSIGLMEACLQVDHLVYCCTPADLTIQTWNAQGSAYANVQQLIGFEEIWHESSQSHRTKIMLAEKTHKMPLDSPAGVLKEGMNISAPEIILQRQDSRQDWTTQQMISYVHPSICVINKGTGTLSTEDKISALQEFPHLCPDSCVTLSITKVCDFITKLQELGETKVVLKATQSYGGQDVEIVSLDPHQFWVHQVEAFVTSKKSTNRPAIIAQKYLSEVKHGDLRMFCVNGKPIAAVNRIPAQDGKLANMAQGGQGKAMKIEDIPSSIIKASHQIANKMKKRGIYIIGIDFIGKDSPSVTELNPGSPTGLIEVEQQIDSGICLKAWDEIHKVLLSHQISFTPSKAVRSIIAGIAEGRISWHKDLVTLVLDAIF